MYKSITSSIKWQSLAKVGMPPKELRKIEGTEVSRTFLLRGEYSITTAFAYDDGSGFITDELFTDNITDWAIVEGF